MTRVMWIDPGQGSGVAVFDASTLKVEHLEIVYGGLKGFVGWWRSVGHSLAINCDVIGCESFELEEGTHGVVLTPVEIISWLKPIGVVDVWQRRNQRGKDKLLTDAVLKRAGLYPARGEVGDKHQVEALRHALNYLIRKRHLGTIKLVHPQEEP